RVGFVGRCDGVAHACGHFSLDLLERRGEKFGLVGEVVIQGAAGHTCGAHDRLEGDFAESVLGEQRPCWGDQRLAGFRCPFGLRAASWSHAVALHTYSMYAHTYCM